MSEAIASVPPRDDFSRTTDCASVGINDLERLAIQFKQENPSLSDEQAKTRALNQMLRDAASKGTPSVTGHANAERPPESSYRGGVHPPTQQGMPVRFDFLYNWLTTNTCF
jgi:hypothetical protein